MTDWKTLHKELRDFLRKKHAAEVLAEVKDCLEAGDDEAALNSLMWAFIYREVAPRAERDLPVMQAA